MQRIHCDAVTGLPLTMSGKTGFSLIVDEYSKFVDVRLIVRKNKMQDHIKEFIKQMDALGHQVERLRTNSTAEFVRDEEFRQWLVSNHVMQEASAPYAKHQNGVVECHIQTIEDCMTALLIQAGLAHAKVSENVYMRQPPGFVDEQHPDYVCKLIQSLYRMHQSGHNWHNLIDEDLMQHGVR